MWKIDIHVMKITDYVSTVILLSFNRRIGVVSFFSHSPICLKLFLAYPFEDCTQKRVYEVLSAVGWHC
jgi:hypothetical protein